MKYIHIASVFVVSLIFAITTNFIATSASFTDPVVAKVRPQASIAGHQSKLL